MNESIAVAVVAGVFAVLAAAIKYFELFGRSRSDIGKDIEIYNALPDSSSAKKKLLENIDLRIKQSIVNETQKRRDPLGIILGLTLFAAGAYFSWFTVENGGWWWLLFPVAVIICIVGIVGFFQDIKKTERNEKGRPIKKV